MARPGPEPADAQGRVKTSGPSSVTAMVCSKWADRLPSAVTTLQSSSSRPGLGRPRVDHGLDGEDHARLERRAPAARASSWGPGAARAWPSRWRGPRTRGPRENPAASATSWTARPISCRRLPLVICSIPAHRLRSVTSMQLLGLLGDVADAHGEGGVAVVALDDGAAVDGEDVPLLEHVGAGDAVDDHVVGRGADHGREAVVAEEVRGGAPALEDLAGHRVELGGGHPGLGGGPGGLVHLGHDLAGPAHLGQLLGVAPHRRLPLLVLPAAGAGRRWPRPPGAVTASGEPVPLISASRLRSLYQSISGAVSAS